jgi:hypothetical protein
MDFIVILLESEEFNTFFLSKVNVNYLKIVSYISHLILVILIRSVAMMDFLSL